MGSKIMWDLNMFETNVFISILVFAQFSLWLFLKSLYTAVPVRGSLDSAPRVAVCHTEL